MRNRVERYWEGKKAVAELERRGYLKRAQLVELVAKNTERENHWNAQKAIGHVCAELKDYCEHLGKVRLALDIENPLKKQLRKQSQAWKVRAQSIKSESPKVASALVKLAKDFEGTIRVIDHYQEERWRYPMWATGILGEGSSSVLTQERELDGRFYERLASRMRIYLPLREDSFKKGVPDTAGISLRTIARLVVLFLVCAELADPTDNDDVKLRHNDRIVSVKSVVQQLSREELK
jgi:hypothetical protein